MARTWLSLTVELLGGRGEVLWPPPGRIFAVGPRHTFADFEQSINDAFSRWDRSHLSMFTLADGRVVTDSMTGEEMAGSIRGPIVAPVDIATAKVTRTVKPGDEFQFTFDFGDDWTHRCVVGDQKVDPLDVLGIQPAAPLPYWGWGSVPDQYGRRWSDDDGESPAPEMPGQPNSMLTHEWPPHDQVPALDKIRVREAIAAQDANGFIVAVTGCEIDDALEIVAEGIPMALAKHHQLAEPVALSVINRLTWRSAPGDEQLAEKLLTALRGG